MQLSLLDAIQEGQKLRDTGIQQAKDTANRVYPGWSDRCWKLFIDWLSEKPYGYQFRIESFRVYLELNRLIESPKNKRSYGFVSVKALKERLIKSNGCEKVVNPKAHCANAGLWMKI